MNVNKLILGDNLDIMKGMDAESVDLIYLDPPFFSNRNYEVIWGDAGEIRSFQDRWAGGIDHYIAWLKERVEQMHRVLKKTGSIFLHCDWHADAYIRVQIMDRIFGEDNFRGDIVWQRHNAHNKTTNKLAPLTDTIWYYSKTKRYIYNPVYESLSDDYRNDFYKYEDEKGIFRLSDLTGSGVRYGESAQEWKGYNPTNTNRHWAIPSKAIGAIVGYEDAEKMSLIEKLELLLNNNLIQFSKNGTPSFKRYLDTSKGNLIGNLWIDIQNVQSQSNERIGYPTQKPEALMRRIVEMASNKGDLVLDPFVGGGTTAAAAERLNRKWIGIDQSAMAVKVTDLRLQRQADLFSTPYTLELHKYDYDTLRHKDAFEFESWIIGRFGGVPQNKKGGDRGVDGKMPDGTPIQVKRSENIGLQVIFNFKSAIQSYDKSLFDKNVKAGKPAGYIIAFDFGKGAVNEVAKLKNSENIIIKLVRVEDIVPLAHRPVIKLDINELERDEKGSRKIEFTARGESAAGIEFYSWDFAYNEKTGFKPSVIIDKDGKQTITVKAGTHNIAVKAIDNDGMENTEVISLKVNGAVERL